jgi:hypothetical protein
LFWWDRLFLRTPLSITVTTIGITITARPALKWAEENE